MWRSIVLVWCALVVGLLLVGGACAPKIQAILCYADKDCPPHKPRCINDLCESAGGESGVDRDGALLDGGGADNTSGGPCTTGQRRSCYSGPQGTENRGICRAGEQLCVGAQWDTCDGEVLPVAETCDGIDNNCDGVVDEGCAQCSPGAQEPCYTGPSDSQGKGACKAGTRVCLGTGQWSACQNQILPAAEICDGIDNNCNGVVDEECPGCTPGLARNCYTGHPPTLGVGACKGGTQTCTAAQTWGPCTGQVLPSRELCDKIDNDCNGQIDEACAVCSPGATKACYPANVAGCVAKGATFACVGACKAGVQRCTPAGQWGHCESAVVPQKEDCNNIDDDCNGTIDDNLSAPLCEVQHGACAGAVQRCNPKGGWYPCVSDDYARQNPKYKPGNDTSCDGIDNNCSGTADEACTDCTVGQSKPCYSGHPSTQNKGPCRAGTQTCDASRKWSACVGQVLPKNETCNNTDDDCDGYVDEAFPEQGQSCSTGQPGLCAQGLKNCVGGRIVCQPLYQPRVEICNGKDDDCNGQIDDNAQTATYYRDQDGDNFGDPKQPIKACLRPAGYVTDNTDCYDKNAQVFPGQPGFFVNHRGDGSFDYNCDGTESKRFTKPGDCKQCQSSVIDIGFTDNPACGKPGKWVDQCRFDVGKCSALTITKYQECR